MLFLSVSKKSSNCTCHPCAGAVLILSVSYVALQSTEYSLLDKTVIDRLNEAAIELTSAVMMMMMMTGRSGRVLRHEAGP